VTELKTPVNPAGGGNRTQGGTVQPPAAPAATDPIARYEGVITGDILTDDEAQTLLNDVGPAARGATGERKAKGWYIMGMAAYKLDKKGDACTYFQRSADVGEFKTSKNAKEMAASIECQ
jgi:hypothetical protein